MTKNYIEVKSHLAKAKGLGSSGDGSHHWILQRLTSLILIPLCIWLAYFLYSVSKLNYSETLSILKHPLHLISALMFLSVGLYHGMLGMQVVIEDYISNLKWRFLLIIKLKLFTFITIFSLVVTAIYFLTQS